MCQVPVKFQGNRSKCVRDTRPEISFQKQNGRQSAILNRIYKTKQRASTTHYVLCLYQVWKESIHWCPRSGSGKVKIVDFGLFLALKWPPVGHIWFDSEKNARAPVRSDMSSICQVSGRSVKKCPRSEAGRTHARTHGRTDRDKPISPLRTSSDGD